MYATARRKKNRIELYAVVAVCVGKAPFSLFSIAACCFSNSVSISLANVSKSCNRAVSIRLG